MATSGNFLTSDSGQGGGNYFGRLIFEWWRTGWGRSGSVGYHNISYTLKSYGGSSGYWQYTYNTSMNVDGTGYSRGQTQTYGAGATTLLSGSKTLYTDGAGNRSFGASAQSGIYTASINSSGSGSWSLDNIPMYATISSYSAGITDEASNVYINYSNPTGSACTFKLYVRPLGSSGGFTQILNKTSYSSGSNVASLIDWSSLRSVLANHKQGQLIYRITNNVGDTDKGWSNEALVTIVNANPTFTTASYKDANASTVAITGDDQYLIQGYGQLEVEILSADQAVPLKSATMSKYNLAISSISQDVTFTTSDINQNLGVLGVNTDSILNVKAIDSRTNFTTVPLTVKVLPYVIPQLTATAQRVNNFETETDIHIEGVISRLTIDSVDKNAVNTTSGVQYRYKKTTDVSWSSWVNVANSTSGANVSVTDFSINLDRSFAWDLEVTLTDKLNTTTVAVIVPVGIPIFRIGLDGHVYNNESQLISLADLETLNYTVELTRSNTSLPMASLADYTGTITIDLPYACDVLLDSMLNIYATSDQEFNTRYVVDSTGLATLNMGVIRTTQSERQPANPKQVATLTAGSHTIKLQVRLFNGGGGTAYFISSLMTVKVIKVYS